MLMLSSLPLLLAACETTPDRTYPVFDDTSEPTADTSDTSDDTGDDTGNHTSDTGSDSPELVRVNYSGSVATVVGSPFGLNDDVAGTIVSGTFAFDRNTADADPGDTTHGVYDHRDESASFTLSLIGLSHTISGSGNPIVVVDSGADSFVWNDGRQPGEVAVDRICSFDGVEDDSIVVEISISPDEPTDILETDALPEEFPFTLSDLADLTISLEVRDAFGSLLLEVVSLQVE